MPRTFDPKTAPIRFGRVAPGSYVSCCFLPHPREAREVAVEIVDRRHGYTMEHAPDAGQHAAEYDLEEERLREQPWELCPRGTCGRFTIRKTEHTGRNVSHQGRTRWWLRSGDGPVPFIGYGAGRHFLSLEDAVEGLNVRIGGALRDAFGAVARFLWERQHAEDARVERERVRADRIERAIRILQEHHVNMSAPIAEQLVDALFPQEADHGDA